MNKETIVILKCLRWLIQKPSMKPEFHEPFDDAMVDKIDKLLATHNMGKQSIKADFNKEESN